MYESKNSRKSIKGLLICMGIIMLAMILLISVRNIGSSWFDSELHSLRGSLIGVSYTIEQYDHFGVRSLTVTGENIDITGNKVSETGIDAEGNETVNYSLSSVLTITIDGKELQTCGSSLILAESGLKKDVDFQMTDIESHSEGNWMSLTSVAKVINQYKNFFGKSRVVVIKSQFGVPICAYSGDEVYWEIPDDLPKMTKVMIDGKALYLHRVNFEIIDLGLL